MLTYFLKIGQKGFNGLILHQFGENMESGTNTIARFSQSRDSANRAIQRHVRQLTLYPYAQSLSFSIGKKRSLTLSCGLGFGFRRMILAYLVDHFVSFQGISLDFFYLLRGRMRQSPKVRGVKGGIIIIIIIIKKKNRAKKKKKSGNLMKRAQKNF